MNIKKRQSIIEQIDNLKDKNGNSMSISYEIQSKNKDKTKNHFFR